MRSACLFLALGLSASTALAQAPVSSITQATLEQYRDQYGQSPVCAKEEITLWSCTTKRREFALCSSPTVTRTTGYLQYRVADAGKLSFAYPEKKEPPLGKFTYNSYPNGDASIEFTNKGYRYSLVDPLREQSVIFVAAPGPSGKETKITCGPNQTLQVNYTMRLMHDAGLWVDD